MIYKSISLVNFDSTFFQTTNDESFIILECNFAIPIEIGHLHPALNILASWIDFHSHCTVCLN